MRHVRAAACRCSDSAMNLIIVCKERMINSMADLTSLMAQARTFVQYGAVLIVVGWLCLRSGSGHMVLARLWSLVHGKLETGDVAIQAFLRERSSLMQFRVMTGVPVRTLPEAHALIDWCRTHNEEVGDIARCNKYFSVATLELRGVPSRKVLAFILAALCFAALLITVLGLFSVSSRALVSVKGGDGTPIFMAASDAYIGWALSHRLSVADCAGKSTEDLVRSIRQPARDVKIICAWFNDPQAVTNVEKVVRDQRASIIAIVAMFAFFWVQSWWSLLAGVRARELDSRLQGHALIAASAAPSNLEDPPG